MVPLSQSNSAVAFFHSSLRFTLTRLRSWTSLGEVPSQLTLQKSVHDQNQVRRAEGEHPHSKVPGPGVRGVNLPPGTGGTPGGTGGGPEYSVDDSDPGVTPAGFPILETKSSMLTVALTSDNLIFTVSNHS